MTSSSLQNGPQNGSANGVHTVTAMSRWSILNKQLPPVDKIKALHIYDFDNTLFKTPLPNPKLWNGTTIGCLANPDFLVNGGWWHDSRILASTGEGHAKEEPRAWEGWWNEKIVELIRLSTQQKDALCVLLTGRSESGFGELIKRMVTSKGLEFDLITLKPAVGPNHERFQNTMDFKQIFLRNLMETYREAEEIRIYEDRPRHVKGFRDFLTIYNKKQNGIGGRPTRGPILGEVIQVADMATNLDPVVEVAEVQHLINYHNEAVSKRLLGARGERLMIKKTVFYTGYLINSADTQRLLQLAQIPQGMPETELKFHANNIMICPRPCPHSILEKVGGMGSKMKWEVTGVSCFENSIWAACLRPVPATAKFHTDNPSPLVVLALRKGARPIDAAKIQNWQPVPPEKAHTFETTVGEKVLLRIEPEDPSENAYESLFPNKASKRKHTGDEESYPKHPASHKNEHFHHHQHGRGGRGGANQGRGGYYRGNGTPNRGYRNAGRGGGTPRGGRGGRGGGHHYKSLDDVGTRDDASRYGPASVMYDDNPQPSGGGYAQQQQQYQQGAYGHHTQPANAPGRPAGAGAGYGAGSAELQNYY
ncbi:Tat pathway signal sequence [Pleurostoma richardsiae]|uniref:Tat pathway signal sequence n=1 Tax=Pleurostoma richardsiae TaxID=41990 RepID=A0AA38VIX4_9PEZI|nr:Tat pathway signal sequence [Pleurostoma richardsiae]